ncbi:choice-of-anchor F family protein [Thiomicrorhabdus sp. Kp2]|uniref:choice-of-anchor F family protein n=1 Tax=Thiomicrorhabdus sp. Kp2 TaxID=1123518 RepID=UPI0003FC895A|nr:choice-of-anchor F family protein [Thiomicrorhabdus sp. Kp2]
MNLNKQFKLSGLSVALLCASLTANAGQIIGVAPGTAYTSQDGPVAFGIGGLNLDNVTPLIVDVETGEEVAKSFDSDTGVYSQMVVGDTFKSLINDGAGNTTGSLHGKDWPVGEPHGIKVVNSAGPLDLQNGSGKPASCILSTSFFTNGDDPKNYDEEGNYTGTDPQDEGWLDTADEANVNPTYCDSPFQTHKRFKVDALTPTAEDMAGTEAKPIDFVFNVDANEGAEVAVREYMVLQKLNNYSDRRYSGIKVEVGFGIGASFTNANGVGDVKLSYTAGDADQYVFAEDDRATFSAGLFGKEDDKHPNGFFDLTRAGYVIDVDENGTIIQSSAAMNSNYVNIFGNWLPSKWEPTGVFYDDDNNPLTDAALVAYWGPSPTDETVAWRKGIADGFAVITEQEVQDIANEVAKDVTLYSVGGIEDLLNLGLTYLVEVGDPTTFPEAANNTFTLRMTPIVSTDEGDDVVPSWIATPATFPSIDTGTDTGTATTSSGGSASFMSQSGLILMILAFLGLGGWIVRNKMSK